MTTLSSKEIRLFVITGLDYWTGLLDWTTGLDYWTGLLDWTTGLDYWTEFFSVLHFLNRLIALAIDVGKVLYTCTYVCIHCIHTNFYILVQVAE